MPKVIKNKNNISKCSCPQCPSYTDCTKKKHEALFCAQEVGKSICPIKMNGCICGSCKVHRENDLKSGYYCMHGSAEDVE